MKTKKLETIYIPKQGIVAVDKNAKAFSIKGKYLFRGKHIGSINSIVNGFIEFEGENVDEVNLAKIIAHSGIEALNDTDLPLLSDLLPYGTWVNVKSTTITVR